MGCGKGVNNFFCKFVNVGWWNIMKQYYALRLSISMIVLNDVLCVYRVYLKGQYKFRECVLHNKTVYKVNMDIGLQAFPF